MLPPWMQSTLTAIIDETPSTKRFFFEIPELAVFDFLPGQFVTFDLPIHEQKNKRWRSYSIASAPNGTNTFELVIVKLEGGLGTAWLWEHGVVGASLTLRGPQGKFTLPETIDRDLYFICTGTGIAPFRSMVHYLNTHNLPHQNLYLIFGCRKFEDSLYYHELKQLETEVPDFHFLPTYSRESADNHLLQRTGYVHAVYEEFILNNRVQAQDGSGLQLSPAAFFLCGWKQMIDQAREKIQALGYDKKAIHFELYG